MPDFDFESIRPYRDDEIPAAMARIAHSEYFPLLASYVYPDRDTEDVRAMIRGMRSIDEFQQQVMYAVNRQILQRSSTAFTYGGTANIDPGVRYLFVSNHRDIMLDSSLLQLILYLNGHTTTEITFGANLMSHPLVIDIGKSNKMFRVERGGSKKEFLRFSQLHSAYIRHTLTARRQSVWIAQRNGRTKDGNDRTEPGLIRMFACSLPGSPARALAELNIVPVAVSYEWEPCDILKAVELYKSRTVPYVKAPGEDLNSILTGILAPKGHIHIEICSPLSSYDLTELETLPRNEYHKGVATLIDRRINSAYYLHPNNYIAHDLRDGSQRYADRYTPDEYRAFMRRLNLLLQTDLPEPDVLKDIFLGIYANPLDSRQKSLAGR